MTLSLDTTWLYTRCEECGSIHVTEDISDLIITENDNSATRNTLPINRERIKRAEFAMGRKIRTALDFGCGEGILVNQLRATGIIADGIDQNTELEIYDLEEDFYDIIFLIEVIEHLSEPRVIFERLARRLVPGGIIMVETTFADSIKEPQDHPYVDPAIGHVNIVSRAGLSKCLPDNLKVEKYLNPHVAILRKNVDIISQS